MQFIDTHTHLYLDEFEADRPEMIRRAIDKGIQRFLLPNIDTESLEPMLNLCKQFPDVCLPMLGLHPTSVKADWKAQLESFESILFSEKNPFIAIGEIGLDFYWDKSFAEAQLSALRTQFDWAKKLNLPVAIHTRAAFSEMLDEITKAQDGCLKGVLHCFTGSLEDAQRAVDLGFLLGIGGVLTYKKSALPEIISQIDMEHLILETDAPFLPPVPYRGKRNESAYMIETALKLATIKQLSMEEIAQQTTQNAVELFKLNKL
ncbi:MAG: TatD family hydrolase [Bacteroidales bacterium]|jgi:TatD DNase family protein|nr:TatD family hydrolase [Bacteroidales bacterium]